MSWVQHGRLAKGSHLFDRSTEYRGKRNKILDYRKVPRFCYVDWLAGCRSEIRGPIDKNAFEITSSMYTYLLWSGLCIVCKPLYSDELSRKKKFIKGPSMTAGYLVCVYVVDLQLKISGDRRRLLFFHFFFLYILLHFLSSAREGVACCHTLLTDEYGVCISNYKYHRYGRRSASSDDAV